MVLLYKKKYVLMLTVGTRANMSYCTIQEAWNVPSFAKKKRNMAPLASQVQCASSGSVIPNASAEPYNADIGPERAAVVEGFACGNPYSAGTGTGVNTASCGKIAMQPDPAQNNIPYATQASDIQYYCGAYNVCPKPQIRSSANIEGFTDSPSANDTCAPIQAPIYTYPMSDASKQAYDKAVKISTNDSGIGPSTRSTPAPMRNVDMSKVGGLYDDEIEQYMSVNNTGTLPPVSPATKHSAVNAKASGFNAINQNDMPNTNTPGAKTDKWQYIMDLFMFIASGILIIVLCDLLFRIALSVGMRDTFQMMEPYLKELAELKSKTI
jgi:hypothetical protein